jgi:hypothetical protein
MCKGQVLVAPMGDIIGLRMEAIKIAMDLLGIQDQIGCLKKVTSFAEELYKKD